MIDEAEALAAKVLNATRIVTDEAPMHSHAAWEANLMLEELVPDDLTPREMIAIAVILAGANARRLSDGPTLRLLAHPGEARRGA